MSINRKSSEFYRQQNATTTTATITTHLPEEKKLFGKILASNSINHLQAVVCLSRLFSFLLLLLLLLSFHIHLIGVCVCVCPSIGHEPRQQNTAFDIYVIKYSWKYTIVQFTFFSSLLLPPNSSFDKIIWGYTRTRSSRGYLCIFVSIHFVCLFAFFYSSHVFLFRL